LTKEGFKVIAIHSGIGASEQMKQLKEFANDKSAPDFIFASPERMATDGFFEYCIARQKEKISLVVIDEIHCISQWGFDFRPFYKHIPVFLNSVFSGNWPTILGLTATINPKELADIKTDFRINSESVLKDDVLLRFDIDLRVEKLLNEEEKKERLWKIVDDHSDEKILVYLYRKYHKGGVEDLCEIAKHRGLSALSFHGDMSGSERQSIINQFRDGTSNLVFATNAFGMGIDIPDIRTVIHFMIPESIEQYYQEIGRAGRDGNGAISYILYSKKKYTSKKNTLY
jgi:ATP-dependent DNA helicase RecQ